jgi:competence protein ComEC
MNDTAMRVRLMTLLLLVCGALVVWTVLYFGSAQTDQYLTVSFLDVGQGDAIFIQTPDGVEVLIDGGPNNKVLRELSKQMSFFDKKINMVVGTHPDSDHIGGLIDVLQRYEVESILMTENHSDTSTAATYAQAVTNEGAMITYARTGQEFSLGDSVTLRVLFPVYETQKMESNASSIVLQLQYGEIEFMLTGDSPKRIEEYLVQEGVDLESEVLKVGHHGSRTSTSEMFLDAVSPQFAVISAEEDSRYGHPHVEVTDRLFNHRVETYSTAEEGTVTFESDGERVWKK